MAKKAEGLVMEVFQGRDAGFYIRLVQTGNHTTLFVSEGYVTMWNAKRAARKMGFEPVVVDK